MAEETNSNAFCSKNITPVAFAIFLIETPTFLTPLAPSSADFSTFFKASAVFSFADCTSFSRLENSF